MTTARQLLALLAPYNPVAIDGGGIEHDELPAHLDTRAGVLATGLAALLTGRRWFGCDGETGRTVVLSPDELIPSGITLLSVEGCARWDRTPWQARLGLPELFAPPVPPAGTTRRHRLADTATPAFA